MRKIQEEYKKNRQGEKRIGRRADDKTEDKRGVEDK
jgi:hypothetical protein